MNIVKNFEVLLFINIKLLKKKYDLKKFCDRVFFDLFIQIVLKKFLNKMRDVIQFIIIILNQFVFKILQIIIIEIKF